MSFRRFLATMRRLQRPVVRVVQVVILQVTLFFLYFIGFGLSKLLLSVFARRVLHNRPRRPPQGDTWWRDAEGYDLDEARLTRQS